METSIDHPPETPSADPEEDQPGTGSGTGKGGRTGEEEPFPEEG